MNRSQHLQWCKDRAIAYLKQGDVANGMASFSSDMSKHEETNITIENGISQMLIMQALLTNNVNDCIGCVNDFN